MKPRTQVRCLLQFKVTSPIQHLLRRQLQKKLARDTQNSLTDKLWPMWQKRIWDQIGAELFRYEA